MEKKQAFSGTAIESKVYSYRIEIDRKHCILINEENKRFLVDTGSPLSMAYETFSFCGEEHHPHGTKLLDSVCELSGLNIEGLIGLDLMKEGGGHVLIDYPNRVVRISNVAFNTEGYTSDIHTLLGNMAICFDAEYNGTPTRCILDTGAQISYINRFLVKDLQPDRTDRDFHPYMGNFEVPMYENLPFTFGDTHIPITCGVLPEGSALAMSASLIADFILGYDLLVDHQVEINFKDRILTIN